MRLVFDVEADDLLPGATTIHSIAMRDVDSEWRGSFTDWKVRGKRKDPENDMTTITDGLKILAEADELVGHNIIGYDIPVLQKIYPWFKPRGKVTDTLVCSNVIFTDIDKKDHPLSKKGILPAKLIGRHSLEAWGFRLGVFKGAFRETGDFTEWSPEMQAYCEQDVVVTKKLLQFIEKQNFSPESLELEHQFATYIHQMTRTGVGFDEEKAAKLYADLVGRRAEIKKQLKVLFPPKVVVTFSPKKKQRKEKTVEFNPGSRVQVAERLMEMGWKPTVLTPSGQAQVDETILESLVPAFPAAKPIADYFILQKRIGQLAEGENAWMKLARNGRIHGELNTNGAATGRCTHRNPNLAQVPRVGSLYGEECRELFVPSPGRVLVGADASGLELRCLAHYLGSYDGGAYAKVVCEGDVHTSNQASFGLPAGKKWRQNAKNGIYARIYGASWRKLGETLGPLALAHEKAAQDDELPDWWYNQYKKAGVRPTQQEVTEALRGMYASRFFDQSVPAYAELVAAVHKIVEERGWLRGLDGRRLGVRSKHSALNTLLQSAGAVIVKKATVVWLSEECVQISDKFKMLLHIHDEVQAEADPDAAEEVGKGFVSALKKTGERWNLRCPLTGEYKIGKNWKECH